MTLQEVLNKKAIHTSGMYFLDSPRVVRRFVVLVVHDHYAEGADGYSATYHVKQPPEFPEDGWILINNE